jgi:hypothetical protein
VFLVYTASEIAFFNRLMAMVVSFEAAPKGVAPAIAFSASSYFFALIKLATLPAST